MHFSLNREIKATSYRNASIRPSAPFFRQVSVVKSDSSSHRRTKASADRSIGSASRYLSRPRLSLSLFSPPSLCFPPSAERLSIVLGITVTNVCMRAARGGDGRLRARQLAFPRAVSAPRSLRIASSSSRLLSLSG